MHVKNYSKLFKNKICLKYMNFVLLGLDFINSGYFFAYKGGHIDLTDIFLTTRINKIETAH